APLPADLKAAFLSAMPKHRKIDPLAPASAQLPDWDVPRPCRSALTLYIISILIGLIAAPVESVFQAVFPLFFPNKADVPDFKDRP
ncbi:hypothetical protein EMGBS8_15920, partial [Verrucomicrobiota bacterium]